ncbi:hypothetical protein L3X38_001408 [Prunus dulcis]|uniref:Uncharacterized protein n=1 Tax=Prunus dulcis TaxID=3755 RepID=A0AAD4WSM1_PRUDU|nr:hypothetical protein L3X38_001408 [Prunus dulcis]
MRQRELGKAERVRDFPSPFPATSATVVIDLGETLPKFRQKVSVFSKWARHRVDVRNSKGFVSDLEEIRGGSFQCDIVRFGPGYILTSPHGELPKGLTKVRVAQRTTQTLPSMILSSLAPTTGPARICLGPAYIISSPRASRYEDASELPKGLTKVRVAQRTTQTLPSMILSSLAPTTGPARICLGPAYIINSPRASRYEDARCAI